MSFNTVLEKYRKISFSQRDEGDRFERLMQAYLLTDPQCANLFKNVGCRASSMERATWVEGIPGLIWWPRPLMETTGRCSASAFWKRQRSISLGWILFFRALVGSSRTKSSGPWAFHTGSGYPRPITGDPMQRRRSADSYSVTAHKESGILNNPNDWAKEVGKPRYILDLLLIVINVSVQTADIVNALPKIKF
jgi:hypothetical protein